MIRESNHEKSNHEEKSRFCVGEKKRVVKKAGAAAYDRLFIAIIYCCLYSSVVALIVMVVSV